jgi:nucleotide-binding universal stress UspA family protein
MKGTKMTDDTSDRLIVAVDGSASSDAAIRWAAPEAARRGVSLTLLHVVTPGLPAGGLGKAMITLPLRYAEAQEAEGLRILESARHVVLASVPQDQRIAVRDELLFSYPAPTLIDATKDAQMVVVGSRGRGAWSRGFLGSVSTALVHHAHCPVAVIRDAVDARHDGSVVLGVDGSPVSELATAIAFDEARLRRTDLVALHAWFDFDVSLVPRSAWPDFRSDAEATLAERLAGWTDRYPDVTVHRRVEFDRPARHLLDAAVSAQLVVVGSHGRGGFAGMLLGSVSTTVVRQANVPVIVARSS